MADDHDIIILGSGSTAFAAALRAEALGARVLMIEKSVLGGTCVNWGCIPSKTLIHSALYYHEALLGTSRGLAVTRQEIDFSRLIAHKEAVVKHLRQTRYLDVLHSARSLTLVKGTGRFLDSRTVVVEGHSYHGDKFLIATGGFPKTIPLPGLDRTDYLTSRSALLLKKFPQSLVIIGGGVIALELGQMYHRLGTAVTILEHGPHVLPAVEREPAYALQQALVQEGMEIILNATACSVEKSADRTVVHAEVEGSHRVFAAERLLLAVGTAPASAGIGLDKAGVAVDDRGFIIVDETMRTSMPGIWAAGDVVGGMMIATAGAREGIVAIEDMLQPGCGCRIDYRAIPMTIFTDPEVGTVGYTEAGAKAAGFDVMTNVLPISAVPKSHVTGSTVGTIKLVADKATRRILGAHLASHRGAEIINEAAIAIGLRATVEDLANSLHVYPSMGEGLRLCAQGFSRDVAKLSCCAE